MEISGKYLKLVIWHLWYYLVKRFNNGYFICTRHDYQKMSDTYRTGQLTWHDGNIPEDTLYIKLGGDHGQGTMKFECQVANVAKPNSTKNTVVFAIFEAKDTRNNLRTILMRYKEQLEELKKSKWQ